MRRFKPAVARVVRRSLHNARHGGTAAAVIAEASFCALRFWYSGIHASLSANRECCPAAPDGFKPGSRAGAAGSWLRRLARARAGLPVA